MCTSLYGMRLTVVPEPVKTGLDMLTDRITCRTEPRVKLHSVTRRGNSQSA